MTITLVNSSDGDWQTLYIDDKLILEGHSLDLYDVLEEICSRLSSEVDISLAKINYPAEKLEQLFNSVMPADLGDLLIKQERPSNYRREII